MLFLLIAVNVIEHFKHNSKSLSKKDTDTVKRVCEAFLALKNPPWTEVYRALEEAEFNKLARIAKATFLTKHT